MDTSKYMCDIYCFIHIMCIQDYKYINYEYKLVICDHIEGFIFLNIVFHIFDIFDHKLCFGNIS